MKTNQNPTVGGMKISAGEWAKENASLKELLETIIANAEIQPDSRMGGTTDIYAVPVMDIESARAALSLLSKGGGK